MLSWLHVKHLEVVLIQSLVCVSFSFRNQGTKRSFKPNKICVLMFILLFDRALVKRVTIKILKILRRVPALPCLQNLGRR